MPSFTASLAHVPAYGGHGGGGGGYGSAIGGGNVGFGLFGGADDHHRGRLRTMSSDTDSSFSEAYLDGSSLSYPQRRGSGSNRAMVGGGGGGGGGSSINDAASHASDVVPRRTGARAGTSR